jgi:radical SAM protein with 4Fe4S-binding SPASM domain
VSIARRMLSRYFEEGRLFALDVELTYRCPLYCQHCYQRGYRSQELSTEDWLAVFDDAREMGVFNLGLTGGEVLTRKDFPELLRDAAKKGFRVFVNTTGNGATRAALEAFVVARPAQVDVSFYAASSELHDGVTGQPGSFQRSLEFVRELAANGLFVRGAFTPLSGVSDEPLSSRDALLDLGVPKVVWNRVDPSVCDEPDRVRALVPDESVDSEVVRSESSVGRVKIGDAICGAGISSLMVQPDGKVVPCYAIKTVVGDLSVQSLGEVWAGSPALEEYRSRRRTQLPHCRTCPDWESCGYCPAEAAEVSGDWRRPAPGFCQHMKNQEGDEP